MIIIKKNNHYMYMPKLKSVTRSEAKGKKWTATFDVGDGKTKKVHFGASSYKDYTIGATDEQRASYRARHSKGKGSLSAPMTPKSLSYYILWGNSRSRTANISSFKKRFNL
mgnify:FL=1